jgi:hypothetical protein
MCQTGQPCGKEPGPQCCDDGDDPLTAPPGTLEFVPHRVGEQLLALDPGAGKVVRLRNRDGVAFLQRIGVVGEFAFDDLSQNANARRPSRPIRRQDETAGRAP